MVTASLLATSMAIGACGDDDGGGGGEEPREDAGGGGSGGGGDSGERDASVDASRPDGSGPDGSTLPGNDAGGDAIDPALLAAADPTGIKVEMSRATLLFTAACNRAEECKDEMWTDECIPSSLASYAFGVENDYSEACRDALLDRVGCYAKQATCALYFENDECLPYEETYDTACAEYMNGGGGDEEDAGT